jgi:hypothetical protein
MRDFWRKYTGLDDFTEPDKYGLKSGEVTIPDDLARSYRGGRTPDARRSLAALAVVRAELMDVTPADIAGWDALAKQAMASVGLDMDLRQRGDS